MKHHLAGEAPEPLAERIYRMRLRQPWVRIARAVNLPVPEAQKLLATVLRGRARTAENLLG